MATHSIGFNFNACIYNFTVGLQNSAIVLIGQKIGAYEVAQAKIYRNFFIIIGLAEAFALTILIYTLRIYIADFYTDIPDLIDSVAGLLQLLAFVQIFD